MGLRWVRSESQKQDFVCSQFPVSWVLLRCRCHSCRHHPLVMFFVRRVRVPSAIYVLHRVVAHVTQPMHRIERALRIPAQRMSGVDI